jgi:hypothetical protein
MLSTLNENIITASTNLSNFLNSSNANIAQTKVKLETTLNSVSILATYLQQLISSFSLFIILSTFTNATVNFKNKQKINLSKSTVLLSSILGMIPVHFFGKNKLLGSIITVIVALYITVYNNSISKHKNK